MGAVRSKHRVSVRTLAVVGIILFVLGAGMLGLLIALNVVAPSSVGPKDTVVETDLSGNTTGYRPGSWGFGPVLVPLGVACFVPGVLALGQAMRRVGARLEVRDRGLVWGNRFRSSGRTWDQVRWLDMRSAGPSSVWARTGLQARCLVVFHDGKRLAFAGNAGDHATLVAGIRRHCPRAQSLPVKQRTTYRCRFAWLGGAVASAAGVAAVAWYISTLPSEVSDSLTNTLAAIILILIIGALVGFAVFMTAGQRGN